MSNSSHVASPQIELNQGSKFKPGSSVELSGIEQSERKWIKVYLDNSPDSKLFRLVKSFCLRGGKFLVDVTELESTEPLTLETEDGKFSGPNTVCKALAQYSSLASQLLGSGPDAEAEVSQWLSWKNTCNLSASARLTSLDAYLAPRAVLAGLGTRISLADLAMFSVIHDLVASSTTGDRQKLPNLMRWFDYIQNKGDVDSIYEKVSVEKPRFQPPVFPKREDTTAQSKLSAEKTERSVNSAETVSPGQDLAGKPAEEKPGPSIQGKSTPGDKPAPAENGSSEGGGKKGEKEKEKKKKEKPPAVKKEVDCSLSVLDIRVGEIKKVWKHPGADTLYVEEIDLGEGQSRQIVSGLAKFLTEDEMLGRRVAVLTNVKPGKVRDVASAGLVLCASNEDHSQCQPIVPPAEAAVGERITAEGHEGAPEEVLNSKKKQFEKIQLDLKTDANGMACFQGLPLKTSAGVCTSSIPNACIK